jgi:hypothetical protein
MQRPTFVTAHMWDGSGKLETPYIVLFYPPKKGDIVPTIVPAMHCISCSNAQGKTVPIKRTEMVQATHQYFGGDGVYCKECNEYMRKRYLNGRSEARLIGWVHDTVGENGYVSVQVGGAIEDESNASTLLR